MYQVIPEVLPTRYQEQSPDVYHRYHGLDVHPQGVLDLHWRLVMAAKMMK